MLDLHLDQIDETALLSLERNEIPESIRLEFKRELNLGSREAKREAAKDVSALANTAGGRLLYGIEEKELPDGSKVAGPIKPLTDGTLDATLSDVLVGSIHPRPRFAVRKVPVPGGFVLVVEVYDSFGRDLHLVTGYGESRFYKRHSQGTFPMTEPEIREAYLRIAASRADLETSLQRQIDSELTLRSLAFESIIVVPWYGTPHLIHPRQLSEFREWLRNSPVQGVGQHFADYFEIFSSGFRARRSADATPAEANFYLAVLKSGLVHFSARVFAGSQGWFGAIEMLDRLVTALEVSRELLDRAAYWGPVRVVHVLRLTKPTTLAVDSVGPFGEVGEIPADTYQHVAYEVNLKGLGHSLGSVAKEILDQLFHAAGRAECPWFGPTGGITEGLKSQLLRQPQSPAARVLLSHP